MKLFDLILDASGSSFGSLLAHIGVVFLSLLRPSSCFLPFLVCPAFAKVFCRFLLLFTLPLLIYHPSLSFLCHLSLASASLFLLHFLVHSFVLFLICFPFVCVLPFPSWLSLWSCVFFCFLYPLPCFPFSSSSSSCFLYSLLFLFFLSFAIFYCNFLPSFLYVVSSSRLPSFLSFFCSFGHSSSLSFLQCFFSVHFPWLVAYFCQPLITLLSGHFLSFCLSVCLLSFVILPSYFSFLYFPWFLPESSSFLPRCGRGRVVNSFQSFRNLSCSLSFTSLVSFPASSSSPSSSSSSSSPASFHFPYEIFPYPLIHCLFCVFSFCF